MRLKYTPAAFKFYLLMILNKLWWFLPLTPLLKGAPLKDATGTARLFITDEGEAKAQRVAVHRSARKLGIGHALMKAVEDEAKRLEHMGVILGAQVSALGFYEKRGYEAYGELFDDAGIPHRMMRLRF